MGFGVAVGVPFEADQKRCPQTKARHLPHLIILSCHIVLACPILSDLIFTFVLSCEVPHIWRAKRRTFSTSQDFGCAALFDVDLSGKALCAFLCVAHVSSLNLFFPPIWGEEKKASALVFVGVPRSTGVKVALPQR